MLIYNDRAAMEIFNWLNGLKQKKKIPLYFLCLCVWAYSTSATHQIFNTVLSIFPLGSTCIVFTVTIRQDFNTLTV